MKAIFISYARADLVAVAPIESSLKAAGIATWRDQERLYAGQRWPKALGEAIAAQQGFLLFWSQAAAASHFVELEWTTALALRKPILPCRLDDTPLPASLSALQAVDARQADVLERILAGLQGQPAMPDEAASTEAVLARLAQTQATQPAEIIRQLNYQQDGWKIQGNVYQVGGDLHISGPAAASPAKDSRLAAWSLRVGLIVALLTGLGLFLDLPGKARQALQTLNIGPPAGQNLSGTVWDEHNQPVAGVRVVIIETGQTAMTGPTGAFQFSLRGEKGQSLRVQAQTPGYVSDPQFVSAGAKVDLTLRPVK